MVVVLDGEACYRWQPSGRSSQNFENVEIALEAGANPVLVAGWWQNVGLHLHIMDAKGRPMPDVTFAAAP